MKKKLIIIPTQSIMNLKELKDNLILYGFAQGMDENDMQSNIFNCTKPGQSLCLCQPGEHQRIRAWDKPHEFAHKHNDVRIIDAGNLKKEDIDWLQGQLN